MNCLLDSIQLHEKRQPNGLWIKSIRFKVPINIDCELLDTIEISGLSDNQNSLPDENHDETVDLMSRIDE